MVALEYVPSETNVADLMTKPLPTARFEKLGTEIGVKEIVEIVVASTTDARGSIIKT